MGLNIRWLCALCLAGLMLAPLLYRPARADIFTAAIGLGGIQIRGSRDISMEKETLYISRKRIKVDYLFKNQTARDVEALVAFPLPEYAVDEKGLPSGKLNFADWKNRENPVNFKLWVNGKPQAFKTQHAIRPAKTAEAPEKQHYKTHFYWRQRFPAGKTVHITHEYQPLFGGGECHVWAEEGQPKKLECASRRNIRKDFCIDSAVEAAVLKMPGFVTSYEVDYILTTGATWKGPIKDFRLIVDKEKPSNIVSFCGENVRKTAPTRFTAEYKNFMPKDDIRVMLFESHDP